MGVCWYTRDDHLTTAISYRGGEVVELGEEGYSSPEAWSSAALVVRCDGRSWAKYRNPRAAGSRRRRAALMRMPTRLVAVFSVTPHSSCSSFKVRPSPPNGMPAVHWSYWVWSSVASTTRYRAFMGS